MTPTSHRNPQDQPGTPLEQRFVTVAERALPGHFVDDAGFVGRLLVGRFGLRAMLEVSLRPDPWGVLLDDCRSGRVAELLRVARSADIARRDRWQFLPLGWVRRGTNLVEEARANPSNELGEAMIIGGFRRLGRRFVDATKTGMPPDMAEDLDRRWRGYCEHEFAVGHRPLDAVDRGTYGNFAGALDAYRPAALIMLGWLAIWTAPPEGRPHSLPGLAFWPSGLTAKLLARLGAAQDASNIRRIIAANNLESGSLAVRWVKAVSPDHWRLEGRHTWRALFSEGDLWLPLFPATSA